MSIKNVEFCHFMFFELAEASYFFVICKLCFIDIVAYFASLTPLISFILLAIIVVNVF